MKHKDEARIDFVDDGDDASSPHISLLLGVKLLVFISRLEIIIIIAFDEEKKKLRKRGNIKPSLYIHS